MRFVCTVWRALGISRVSEQFDVMMEGFDFLKLVAQQPERLGARAFERLLRGLDAALRFAFFGAVFLPVQPRHVEGNARAHFADACDAPL